MFVLSDYSSIQKHTKTLMNSKTNGREGAPSQYSRKKHPKTIQILNILKYK